MKHNGSWLVIILMAGLTMMYGRSTIANSLGVISNRNYEVLFDTLPCSGLEEDTIKSGYYECLYSPILDGVVLTDTVVTVCIPEGVLDGVPTREVTLGAGTSILGTFEVCIDSIGEPYNEGADTIAGFISQLGTLSGTTNLGCNPKSRGDSAENIEILVNLTGTLQNQTGVTISDGSYFIAEPVSGLIDLTPSLIDTLTGGLQKANGVTSGDAVIILRHISKTAPFDCPLLRLAADVDNNGQIDTLDLIAIVDLVLQKQDTLPEKPWRFVPSLIAQPSVRHPDIQFATDFWDTSYPDSSKLDSLDIIGYPLNPYYPFDATLNLNGITYTYNGENSWMDKVVGWPYENGDGCSIFDFCFWLIKTGDVNNTASLDFVDPNSMVSNFLKPPSIEVIDPIKFQLEVDYYYQTYANVANQIFPLIRPIPQEYGLEVQIKSDLPIEAYQVGLKINPRDLKIQRIKERKEGKIKQNLRRNYNDTPDVLNRGIIRTLWWQEDFSQGRGVDVVQWTKIIDLDLELKPGRGQNVEDLKEKISIDPKVLKTEFYSNGENVSDQVEIRVLLVPKD